MPLLIEWGSAAEDLLRLGWVRLPGALSDWPGRGNHNREFRARSPSGSLDATLNTYGVAEGAGTGRQYWPPSLALHAATEWCLPAPIFGNNGHKHTVTPDPGLRLLHLQPDEAAPMGREHGTTSSPQRHPTWASSPGPITLCRLRTRPH